MILNFKVRDFATYVALEANGQGGFVVIIFITTLHHLTFIIKSFR